MDVNTSITVAAAVITTVAAAVTLLAARDGRRTHAAAERLEAMTRSEAAIRIALPTTRLLSLAIVGLEKAHGPTLGDIYLDLGIAQAVRGDLVVPGLSDLLKAIRDGLEGDDGWTEELVENVKSDIGDVLDAVRPFLASDSVFNWDPDAI